MSTGPVDPDMQFSHLALVKSLHQSLYSRPFFIPPITDPPAPHTPTKAKSHPRVRPSPSKSMSSQATETDAGSVSYYDGDDMRVIRLSMLSVYNAEIQLRSPSRLRRSQLTDRTFRQYLLDHMTTRVVRCLVEAEQRGSDSRDEMLGKAFPEYAELRKKISGFRKYTSARVGVDKVSDGRRVLGTSSKENSQEDGSCSTPRAIKRKSSDSGRSYRHSMVFDNDNLTPYTTASILAVPDLVELAGLVVDTTARREERRRLRRIADGFAKPNDHAIERDRVRKGKGRREYKLTDEERRKMVAKLIKWALGEIGIEGTTVAVSSALSFRSRAAAEEDGYLPLPPELMLPLIASHIHDEIYKRAQIVLKKGDPRREHGVTTEELLRTFQSWGQAGRWERMGEWAIQAGLDMGVRRGVLEDKGRGWVVRL
jgi:hypothetical protein